MIPIRANTAMPITALGGIRQLSTDHPLIDTDCPVCDNPIGTEPMTLVLVGWTDDRKEFGRWGTGVAVAVHAACTVEPIDGSTYEPPTAKPDEQSQAEREQPRLFTDIDRDTNPYLRVRAFINAARQKPDTNGQGIASVIDNDGVMHMLTEDDVEGLLDDVGEMQEEIDRLIGELVKVEGQQAERDADVRAVRALTGATSKMLGRWADANETVRRELWTEVHERADDVHDRFRERFAALDARAASGTDA